MSKPDHGLIVQDVASRPRQPAQTDCLSGAEARGTASVGRGAARWATEHCPAGIELDRYVEVTMGYSGATPLPWSRLPALIPRLLEAVEETWTEPRLWLSHGTWTLIGARSPGGAVVELEATAEDSALALSLVLSRGLVLAAGVGEVE